MKPKDFERMAVVQQSFVARYLELWCRTHNDGFVSASRPQEMAFFSGFDGERAQRTWLFRKKLHEPGFIDAREGPSGSASYILIENRCTPSKKLRDNEMIPDQLWDALIARMIEIGTDDVDDPLPDEKTNE